jgi:hypothetical protein
MEELTEQEADMLAEELVSWGVKVEGEVVAFPYKCGFSLRETIIVAYEEVDDKDFSYEIFRRDNMTSIANSDHYKSIEEAMKMAKETADHQL